MDVYVGFSTQRRTGEARSQGGLVPLLSLNRSVGLFGTPIQQESHYERRRRERRKRRHGRGGAVEWQVAGPIKADSLSMSIRFYPKRIPTVKAH